VLDGVAERQDGEPGPLVDVGLDAGVRVERWHVEVRLLWGDGHGAVKNDLKVGMS